MEPLHAILAKHLGHAYVEYMREAEQYCADEYKREPKPLFKHDARVQSDIITDWLPEMLGRPEFGSAIRYAAVQEAL